MSALKGPEAANRKLPHDEDFAALLRAGLGRAEIAARYGVSVTAVYKRIVAITGRDPYALMPDLPETSAKIVTRRDVLDDGRDFRMKSIRISLPRIPTLHGQFVSHGA